MNCNDSCLPQESSFNRQLWFQIVLTKVKNEKLDQNNNGNNKYEHGFNYVLLLFYNKCITIKYNKSV